MTTVLVVDDNPATLRMLTAVLRTDGYRVLGATDGEAALALVANERPELCLIDIILPGFDGYELARRLRALPDLIDVPLIALSGLVGSEVAMGLPPRTDSRQEAHEPNEAAHFDAWLVKPVEPESLLKLVAAHLPEVPSPNLDSRGTTVLVVDDDPVQAKLTRLHLTTLGFEVTLARSGQEALSSARTLLPDAVVSDVLMPDMDGFELCLAIRSEPSLAKVPVLLVSAHYRDRADHELAHRVGANALLVKTPDLADLATAIGAMVRFPPRFTQPREGNGVRIQAEHRLVVANRLERAIATSISLSQRCSIMSAQLSLIGSIADALTQAVRVDAALQTVLETCFDAAGISRGALFLDRGQGLHLAAIVGFGESELQDLGRLFGHPELLERVVTREQALALPTTASADDARASTAILAGSRARSAHLVPLVHDESLRGALFL
ncbi:MAG TPA: response regulator, partial [Myxococcota bacterium]|nr:response regulator [Myxococcota bacterium]